MGNEMIPEGFVSDGERGVKFRVLLLNYRYL